MNNKQCLLDAMLRISNISMWLEWNVCYSIVQEVYEILQHELKSEN